MKTSNPFVPTVTLIDLPQRNRREQFKIGIYTVLIAQLLIVLGLLMFNTNRTTAYGSGPSDATSIESGPTTMLATKSESSVAETSIPPVPVAASLAQPTPPATPSATASPTVQPSEVSYVVKSGDTLIRIARIHGTTVKAIKSANSLDTERLVVGRKLKIPDTKA